MSPGLLFDHREGIEGRLRNLLAGSRPDHGYVRRHNHAEHALDPLSAPDSKGHADVSAHRLDFGRVHEELWASESVDRSWHIFLPGFLCAFARGLRRNTATGKTCSHLKFGLSAFLRRHVAGHPFHSGTGLYRNAIPQLLGVSLRLTYQQPERATNHQRDNQSEHPSSVYAGVIVAVLHRGRS